MSEVQYRLLLFRRGGAFGDRLVVGLVHWDGETLRSAFNESRAAECDLAADDRPVRGAVRAWRAHVERCAAARATQQRELFEAALDEVVWLPSGAGSALEWSPVRIATPTRAEEHFTGLCALHSITSQAKAEQERLTAAQLRDGLRELGQRLVERLGSDRVKVGDAATAGVLGFNPPLSWQNGIWHHAIPVSFDTSKPGEMVQRAYAAAGCLQQGVGPNEVAVVVLAMPTSEDGRAQAERCREALERSYREASFIEAGRTDEARFAQLEQLIERDVSTPH